MFLCSGCPASVHIGCWCGWLNPAERSNAGCQLLQHPTRPQVISWVTSSPGLVLEFVVVESELGGVFGDGAADVVVEAC